MNMASSYASSKSFIKFDEIDLTDQRVPDQVETLPTGLRLILDDNFVRNVWNSEKQRESLQDLLVHTYSHRSNICDEKTSSTISKRWNCC